MIFTNTALTRLLGAIETDSLVVLCGAGLSRASPSELSLAVDVSRSCYDRWNAIEPLDPSLRGDLDALAGYFYDKSPASFVSEFLKIVPWDDLVGPPNEGHAAVADFLVTRAASAAMTSNFDALIESWAEALRVDLRGALTGQSATGGSVSPLLKFHGCMRLDRHATLWTHRQLDEAAVQSRIKSCSDWMTLHLPGKHLLVVGFWTDWGYLNDVLESSFGITKASSVTVVDLKASAALQSAAPGLWSVLNGMSASFEHVMASGADALRELRAEFSRQWLRRYYSLGSGMAAGAGIPVNVASPFDTLDGEDLYRLRRDVETTPYDRAAREKVPPANAGQAAFFHVRLLNAGAGQAGAWSLLGGESIRVVNGAGRDLQSVRAAYREPPSIPTPDYCVCAGAIDLGVPGRVISSGVGRSTVKTNARRCCDLAYLRAGRGEVESMNELVSRAQSVLLGGGYTTRLVSVDDVPVVLFEDEVVSGFVFVLQSPQAVLQRWRDLETSLLTRFARNLRMAGDKAWNVYSVFLCEAPCDAALSRQVAWIEEDLQRTRKAAACGVDTRERVVGALLPLLPLQHQPELGPEDLTERLRARIHQVAPEATEAYLDESVSAAEVVRLLRGTP